MVDIAKIPQTIGVAVGGSYEIYNVDIDATNFERGYMRWNANVLEFGTEKGGTGVLRDLLFNKNLRLDSSGRFITLNGGILRYGWNFGGTWEILNLLAFNGANLRALFNSTGGVYFSTGNVQNPEIGLGISTANKLSVNAASDGTLRDLLVRMLAIQPVAVSQLQPPTNGVGIAVVNDALSPVSGDPVVGGGTVTKLVLSDQTTWRVV